MGPRSYGKGKEYRAARSRPGCLSGLWTQPPWAARQLPRVTYRRDPRR